MLRQPDQLFDFFLYQYPGVITDATANELQELLDNSMGETFLRTPSHKDFQSILQERILDLNTQ